MVYDDEVWALIGSLDGASTHLAEQVVAKARVPLLNPASGDHTVHMANVPWMFSCLPGDDAQAELLAQAVAARPGPFFLLSADDHDARVFVGQLKAAWSRSGAAPGREIVVRQGRQVGLEWMAGEVLASSAGQAVVIAGPADSARMVAALRDGGFRGTIFGGPSVGRRLFLEESGADGEGVLFPLLYEPAGDDPFPREFQARFGRAPDYATAHTYDAVRLLVQAVRQAGPNRARIRDALEEAAPVQGVTGTIRWDSLGQNRRAVRLGTIQGGQIVRLPPVRYARP
jgi:branched-chain amino acid transport system substrate-binding protein